MPQVQALSPVGLLLATILCVANVFADVSRKKVVEGRDLVSATFWIRFFAAIVFTIPLIVYALISSPPIVHPLAAFTAADFPSADTLVAGLAKMDKGISGLIWGEASQETKDKLLGAQRLVGDETKETLLAKAFNAALVKIPQAIETSIVFGGVHFSEDTVELLARSPKGEALNYSYRLRIEDSFPEDIVKRRDSALFGSESLQVAPLTAFFVYLFIDVAMISMAQLLLMRALQVSPMSMCIPFMAFTPVFLVPAEYVILGQTPLPIKLIGIGLIVIGSLVMQRQFFAEGWLAPLKAIFQQRGSRYILLVAFILAITSPVERQLGLMSDPFTTAFSYGLGLCVFFAILAAVKRAPLASIMRSVPIWALVAGFMDAVSILILYFTFAYIPVSITISIKRAGVIVAIFAGWLFFKERDLTNKLIAASVMLGGMLIFYLPLSLVQAIGLAVVTLVGMVIALIATRPRLAFTPDDPLVTEIVAEGQIQDS